tara:strand:- start:127 stop:510 length:384 start_codon:yes stop_codon:yes gene_type:complete
MKKILLVLLLMVSINCFSQTESDSVLIPRSELNEVFNAIDTLMEQDSIKNILISDLKIQIDNYKLLSRQDSILLMYNTRQIGFLNQEIKLYDDRLKKVDKWYNKPWVGFVVGAATITLSSYVLDNIK